MFAGIDDDLKLLANDEFQKRSAAEARLAKWVVKNPSKAKKRLFDELKKTDEPEVSQRLFGLLRKAVIDEKFGPNKAFLGIRMDDSQFKEGEAIIHSVVIREVEPNTAAELAGLRIGDQIFRVNGELFKSLEETTELVTQQLQKIIQSEVPGASLRLEVKRGGIEHEISLKLGEMSPKHREKFSRVEFPEGIRNFEEFFENWLLEQGEW